MKRLDGNPASVQPEELRATFLEAMSHAAASVSVVTTDGPAGRAGVTVSAMTSVSADSPALLVCLHHAGSAAPAILRNGVFCVNLLRDDQTFISDVFAGRVEMVGGERFGCAQWTHLTTGAPRLVDPLVAFDCRLMQQQRCGTHHVLFGAVEDVFVAQEGRALVYANRGYAMPAPLGCAA